MPKSYSPEHTGGSAHVPMQCRSLGCSNVLQHICRQMPQGSMSHIPVCAHAQETPLMHRCATGLWTQRQSCVGKEGRGQYNEELKFRFNLIIIFMWWNFWNAYRISKTTNNDIFVFFLALWNNFYANTALPLFYLSRAMWFKILISWCICKCP